MTLLFVNSIGKKKWGGGEKWIINTAIGLQSLGHDITIGARKNSILARKAKNAGLKILHLSYNTDFSLYSSLKLAVYLKKTKTDVVIGSLNRDVRIAGFASRIISNGPKVIGRQGVQLIKKKWKYKFTFKNLSDGILTNSNSLKNLYDSFGWWDNNFVKVIYNGITANGSAKSTFDYSTITSINEDTTIILSAGRLDKQKGFRYLVLAAKYAKENHKNWKFFIAGTGRQYTYLSKLIAQHNLEDTFFFLGFKESIHPLFKRADIFVLPSLYEGMPNVILESMLEGVPVISTPVNGAFELIDDKKTGLFVPVEDPKSIYDSIEYLVQNPEKRNKIAQKAQKHIEINFNIKESVKKVNSYLEEIISK
ncbi:glycosyltransferase [Labilibacter sediminis]|nr:glycosyltransferase [Labilibacter sediminis]